ncbi:MAG: hypothetical protein OXJ90_22925 [Spirochaetaceae bacterium]|nr:hypothetical protein [Spirochaetaceae bacterium]
MLAVVLSTTERYDAGSMSLCLAAEMGSPECPALVIDADIAAGGDASLAERLGTSQRRSFEPWVRGLPTLLAARSRFSEELISEHVCVPDGTDSWLLLGPASTAGRHYAHDWVDRHINRLRRLDSGRVVLVTASLAGLEARPSSLPVDADAVVMLASGEDSAELSAAARRCVADGDGGDGADPRRDARWMAMVADNAPLADAAIIESAGCEAVVRLPARDDARVLQTLSRRQRRLAGPVSEIAVRLLEMQATLAGGVA